MHKTSSYFLQHFDPEGSSSGNTRLETVYFVKRVSSLVSTPNVPTQSSARETGLDH